MDVREKLVELLESAESAIYWNSEDKSFIEKIADHLIAHGVTIPVHCKDCANSDTIDCSKGMVWCGRMCRYMKEDGFCSFGERKEN